jgi:uncharacterized repeat protein (TIGR01451 family)
MHLIPRRATRRVLVLLLAMGGLLAVPALALAHSDLSLVKAVDKAEAAPGDLLTYTLVIQQHGTHANPPGTVTDTLPPYTTYVSSSAGCVAVGSVITCPIGPVGVGESVTITITVRVDDNVPAGDLVNVADVTAPGDTPTTNNHGEAITSVHFAGLGDFVWWDQNHNGLQDAGEPGFAGVTLHIYDSSGALIGTTKTDAAGLYRFDRLRPGTAYAVCIDAADGAAGGPLAGFELTIPNAGSDDAIDSDAVLVNGVPCISPATTGPANSFVPTYDFGFWEPGALGDWVWNDANHNGIQDAGEVGVGGVGVDLHDATGAVIGHTTTDAKGFYLFDRLPPGTYRVCWMLGTLPPGYNVTTKDAPGSTRANGSDAGADGCTDLISLAPGQRDLDWDAGIWKAPAPPSGGGSSGAVSGKPKLALKKTGKPAVVPAGSAVGYTLVVTNIGKATAHDVQVCDTLPAGVTVTSTGGGKLSAGKVCWTVGTLAKGKHKQYRLAVKVDVTQRGTIKNNAVATASDAGPARAASSTQITVPKSRHGVAGVTG